MQKLRLAPLLLVIAAISSSFVRAESDPRVEGVANYLASLSTKNFNYIVEKHLLDNSYLQCYYPNVYSSIETVGLMNAINFNPETWQTQFERDLERYFGIAMLQVLDEDKIETFAATTRDAYIEDFLQKFQAKSPQTGELIDLDFIPFSATPEERILINRFSDSINTYINNLYDLQTLVMESRGDVCSVANDGSLAITNVIVKFDDTLTAFKNSTAALTDIPIYFEGVEVNTRNIALALTAYTFMQATGITENQLQELAEVADSDNYEVKLLYIFSKLEDAKPDLRTEKAYNRFKDFIFLSAKLADADNANSVETALNTYLADEVSFGTKRQFTFNLTAQAYFGIAYDSQLDDTIATLPIGLEGSYNLNGYPVGIMIGIIDFAGPTVAALEEDSTSSFQWEELISPSVGLSVGWNDLPLALTSSYTFKTEAVRVGVSLDMPLLDLSR
ncbi:MAG: hypothetical protein ABJ000_10835 [Saccharospirillum sp.]|uniref:hypothetical protein n=1 Tax=Saccharospirillum sp. TaxID=2033801 RepID=UPI0032991DED